jgi:hypothetical protein
MSRKRKPSSGDPRKQDPDVIITVPGAKVPTRPFPPGSHPGGDVLSVIYPAPPPDGIDLATWFETHPPEIRTEDVTRDEFVRRMAGSDVVRQVNSDPLNRVIALMESDAIIRWWETAR